MALALNAAVNTFFVNSVPSSSSLFTPQEGSLSAQEEPDSISAAGKPDLNSSLSSIEQDDRCFAEASIVGRLKPIQMRHKRLIARAGRRCFLKDLDTGTYRVKIAINSQSEKPVSGVIDVYHRMGYIALAELVQKGVTKAPDEGWLVETPEKVYHVHSVETQTIGECVVRYAMRLVG